MLQNAYLLAKISADTAENEQHFAEILPIGRRVAAGGAGLGGPLRGLVALDFDQHRLILRRIFATPLLFQKKRKRKKKKNS